MCDRCDQLEEEVAFLKSELGLQHEAADIHALVRVVRSSLVRAGRAYSGANAPAKMAMVLYRANGRPLSVYQIMECIPPKSGGEDERNPNIVAVWVTYIRKALGVASVETVYGRGFLMSAAGRARVAEFIGESLATVEARTPSHHMDARGGEGVRGLNFHTRSTARAQGVRQEVASVHRWPAGFNRVPAGLGVASMRALVAWRR